jgi:hypothetical protein
MPKLKKKRAHHLTDGEVVKHLFHKRVREHVKAVAHSARKKSSSVTLTKAT